MHRGDAIDRFESLAERVGADEYNYEHYRVTHLVREARLALAAPGLHPGELAPDFALASPGGEVLRLSDLRGRPVLLHFSSYT